MPANPLPASAGPFSIPRAGAEPLVVTWTRTARRTYASPDHGSMAAALYSDGGSGEMALICNAYSDHVSRAANAVLFAASVYGVHLRLVTPLWPGVADGRGAERPRGIAGLLRVLRPDLYPTTTLGVPSYFQLPA